MAVKKIKTLTEQDKIKQERERLDGIFSDLSEDIKNAADKLIDNAAFMAVTLATLADNISRNGCTEDYQNGANQWGKKRSVDVDVYNTMIKNYKSVIDTLISLVPDRAGEDASKELLAFVRGEK